MDENKNSKEIENNTKGQNQSYTNDTSSNLNEKNNNNNNISEKEMNDYKSYLKKNDRSLYELFSSELFTIELLLDYLIHKEDHNIIDFLIDILYNRFQDNILYYLPQLCSLTICKTYYNPIESFIINHSSEDLKFAVSANWIYESFIQDNFSDHKKNNLLNLSNISKK